MRFFQRNKLIQDHSNTVMHQWKTILVQSGVFGSFDVPLSHWSWTNLLSKETQTSFLDLRIQISIFSKKRALAFSFVRSRSLWSRNLNPSSVFAPRLPFDVCWASKMFILQLSSYFNVVKPLLWDQWCNRKTVSQRRDWNKRLLLLRGQGKLLYEYIYSREGGTLIKKDELLVEKFEKNL